MRAFHSSGFQKVGRRSGPYFGVNLKPSLVSARIAVQSPDLLPSKAQCYIEHSQITALAGVTFTPFFRLHTRCVNWTFSRQWAPPRLRGTM